jgi:parallel beta helix pectate lyase-like protein
MSKRSRVQRLGHGGAPGRLPACTLLLCGLLVGLFLAARARAAGTLNVPASFPTIQAAINAAANGDTVLVAPGLYTGPGNTNLDLLGKRITVRSVSGPNSCAIDCGGVGRAFAIFRGEPAASVVEGFAIVNGIAGRANGGGMYIANSHPTVRNCIFSGNGGGDPDDSRGFTAYGGGIFITGGSPAIANCTFSNNRATSTGAGIAILGGAPTIMDCAFVDNEAYLMVDFGLFGGPGGGVAAENSSAFITRCLFRSNNGGAGGGLSVEGPGQVRVSDCFFDRNRSTGGGGMDIWNSSPTVTGCIFTGNACFEWGSGGGMSIGPGCNPIVAGCVFRDNRAMGDGGGIVSRNGSPTITHCSFERNDSSLSEGGAMLIGGIEGRPEVTHCVFKSNGEDGVVIRGDVLLANCTFVGHTFGALTVSGSISPVVIHCTFAGNHGQSAVSVHGSARLTLTNSILWDNDAPQIEVAAGAAASVTHTDVQGGFAGTGNLNANPRFVRDPSDGGNGWLDNPDTAVDESANNDYGDLRLRSMSPCINAGTAATPFLPATDLEDEPRVTGPAPDMGAFESGRPATLPSLTVTSPNGGEILRAGTLRGITWSSSGVTGNVRIEYSGNGGASWIPVYLNTENDGFAFWTVQGPHTNRGRIRITALNDTGRFDVSDRDFTICSLTLLAPNGGEKLRAGTNTAITWRSEGLPGSVKIEYGTGGSASWIPIYPSTENDGFAVWTVHRSEGFAFIRISSVSDPACFDISDGSFRITVNQEITLAYPNGGETLVAGTNDAIIWNAPLLHGDVKIEYSTDGGLTWRPVYHRTENDGYALWTVQGPPTAQGRIRITWLEDSSYYGVSERDFTIRPG